MCVSVCSALALVRYSVQQFVRLSLHLVLEGLHTAYSSLITCCNCSGLKHYVMSGLSNLVRRDVKRLSCSVIVFSNQGQCAVESSETSYVILL